ADSGFVAQTFFLMKTDSAGNMEWARSLGGYGSSWAACVKPASDGGYVLSGRETWSGNTVFAVIKTDSLGHTNECMEGIPAVTVTAINDTMINLTVTDSILNITSVLQNTNPPLVGNEITVCSPVGIQETLPLDFKDYLKLIPNPAGDYVNVFYRINDGNAMMKITDVTGKLLMKVNLSWERKFVKLDTSSLQPGLYIYSVISGDSGIKSGKLVIK